MAETPRITRMAKRAQAQQQDLSRFIMEEKENLYIYADNVGGQRSPLPVGYPRAPLQDITDVLSPINRMNDGEEGQGEKKKPKPKARKKSTTRPCLIFEDEPSSSSQDPAPLLNAESGNRKGILANQLNSKVQVENYSKKTVRFATGISREGANLCTTESDEVKVVIQSSATEIPANPTSPTSQRIKRRKPPVKSTAGKNLATFR